MNFLSISTSNFSDIIPAVTAIISALLAFQQIISSGLKPEELDTLVTQSNLSPANKQKVVIAYNKARTRSKLAFIMLLFVSVLATAVFFINIGEAAPILKQRPLKLMLMSDNKDLFDKAPLDDLEFARVFPSSPSVIQEGGFSEMIKNTKKSFWIMTTAFKQLQNEDENIQNLAMRGGHIRILLLDTLSLKRTGVNHNLIFNCDPEHTKVYLNTIKGNFQKTLQLIQDMRRFIREHNGTGTIEVKIYKMPLNYQIWVKDGDSENGRGLAQVNSFQSTATGFSAYFRVTPQSSRRLFKNVVKEFTKCWDDEDNGLIQDKKK